MAVAVCMDAGEMLRGGGEGGRDYHLNTLDIST